MTVDQLVTIFEGAGLPLTYYQWNEYEVPALPYLVYYFPTTRPEAADNTMQAPLVSVNLELYTAEKDFQTEAQVEAALTAGGLVFSKAEAWIQSESMFQVLYQMEDVITYGQN